MAEGEEVSTRFENYNGAELKRLSAVEYARHFIGTWYSWGGDDPAGMDCSGYCIEILKSVGILPRRFDTNAIGLYARFGRFKVPNPYKGCLAFWQDKEGDVCHVEFCIDQFHTLGASGGGSKTITKADAMRHNAFIKQRPIKQNRVLTAIVDPFKSLE